MKRERRKFSASFKAKVVLEAIKEKRLCSSCQQSLKFTRIKSVNESVIFFKEKSYGGH
jgi:hypothetical protein